MSCVCTCAHADTHAVSSNMARTHTMSRHHGTPQVRFNSTAFQPQRPQWLCAVFLVVSVVVLLCDGVRSATHRSPCARCTVIMHSAARGRPNFTFRALRLCLPTARGSSLGRSSPCMCGRRTSRGRGTPRRSRWSAALQHRRRDS